MRIEIELSGSDPPVGWLQTDGRSRRRFGGWLELFGLLQAATASGEGERRDANWRRAESTAAPARGAR